MSVADSFRKARAAVVAAISLASVTCADANDLYYSKSADEDAGTLGALIDGVRNIQNHIILYDLGTDKTYKFTSQTSDGDGPTEDGDWGDNVQVAKGLDELNFVYFEYGTGPVPLNDLQCELAGMPHDKVLKVAKAYEAHYGKPLEINLDAPLVPLMGKQFPVCNFAN